MKKSTKKLSQAFLPIILIFALSITAFASSYSSTFEFKVGRETPVRNYTGQNISFSATSSQDWQCSQNYYYEVQLWRSIPWARDSKIGTVSNMPREGYKQAKWSNVGPGDYYFNLSKANDGVTLKSSDVKMKNY